MDNEQFMLMALQEAHLSLRTGGDGYGAVIVKDGKVLSSSGDSEDVNGTVKTHAEINALNDATGRTGGNLAGCVLFVTHQPCTECVKRTVAAGIRHFVIGYCPDSDFETVCEALSRQVEPEIVIERNVLPEECRVLYREDVRLEIRRLNHAELDDLKRYNVLSSKKRCRWFHEYRETFGFLENGPLESAYRLLLMRFRIDPSEAPVVLRTPGRIVFHSRNFCPTLEACKILGLDTRFICKWYNEQSTDRLIKQVNEKLQFARNYDKLRPYAEYCEEMILLE